MGNGGVGMQTGFDHIRNHARGLFTRFGAERPGKHVGVQFGRAMRQEEFPDYQKTIQDSLSLLGKKDLTLILHGGSFPAVEAEDTGMGSSNSNGAKKLVQFLAKMGFNGLQLGPGGKTKGVDPSPYTSTSFSNNPLFIDLAPLASDSKWAGLLAPDTLTAIVGSNPNQNRNRVAYGHVYGRQEEALREAYRNYQQKLARVDSLPQPEAEALRSIQRQFTRFQDESKAWLEKDALYEALSELHGNDYWPVWPNDLDKRLFNPANEAEAQAVQTRIDEVKAQKAETFGFYQFVQFVADTQKEEMKTFAKNQGIKMLADRQVAFSDRDVWAYQNLFLEGFSLGAPPDYFSKDGQGWGFPIFDPEKLLNADGSLGPAGKVLRTLFDKIFKDNRGGVRIDHIIGLIDPWVYPKELSPKAEDGAGRLYSSPEHSVLGKYSRITQQNLDNSFPSDHEERVATLTDAQVDRYCEVMRIIIQSAEAQGLGKDAIICEDLGTLTQPVKQALEKLDLSGVRVTQFVDPAKANHIYRGKNVEPKQWIMVGTHDNESLAGWADGLYQQGKVLPHAENLAEDLKPANLSGEAAARKKEELLQGLLNNPKQFVKAKFVELFASPAQHIQLFFTDFFGMKETYNRPGTSGDENWSLRVPNAFEQFYHQKLSQDEGLNLPEVLLMALQARGVAETAQNQPLVQKLAYYQNVLKQSEVTV